MASSVEPVQIDSANGGNVGGIGSDERPIGPLDAEVLVVGESRPGDPTLPVLNDGIVKRSHLVRVLYNEFGWLRHSSKQKARCPSCTATVIRKICGNTSNL